MEDQLCAYRIEPRISGPMGFFPGQGPNAALWRCRPVYGKAVALLARASAGETTLEPAHHRLIGSRGRVGVNQTSKAMPWIMNPPAVSPPISGRNGRRRPSTR